MDWLNGLFITQSSIQSIIILAGICALGLALGKIKIFGISLGIAFVFFIGILAGHFGLAVDAKVISYTETFGLVIFIYMLGLRVGPTFFSSLQHEGFKLNMWSLGIIFIGTIMTVLLGELTGVSLPDMVGILCGATTNTPALGAAQQAMEHLGRSGGTMALGTAVSYPFGVVGVILVMVLLRKLCVKDEDLESVKEEEENHTYVGRFVVTNPGVADKSLVEISQMTHVKFIISRIWRGEQVIIPLAQTQLHLYDNLLVVTNKDDVGMMEILFGEHVEKDWNREKIDWNHLDAKVESRIIVVTQSVINGRKIGHLQLRRTYGVNVSRVRRGDIQFLGTDDLILRYGDFVTVVGEAKHLDQVEKLFGNATKRLDEPNLGSIMIGVILGLAVGTIPLTLPGMSAPVRLGIAGGPIIIGILVGAIGPRLHLISYSTTSVSLMLRRLGLSLYLACLGLDAGKDFFSTLVRPEGLLWIGLGAILTIVPILLFGLIALKTRKLDFPTVCGILCGAMANPMALGYANDTLNGDTASVSYASVYPLGMFLRVVIAQMLIVAFL